MGARIAGDVAISADIAAANARRLGHSAGEEIKILVLHGVLHLAGFDHETDDGKMARKEVRLRKALGLPAGLIERNGQPENSYKKRRQVKSHRARNKSRAIKLGSDASRLISQTR